MKSYNIVDFGASVDNQDNSSFIQKAIDEASKNKGKVIIPEGTFKSGTIFLKSNICLYLDKGAVLQAGDDISMFDITKKEAQDKMAVPSYENCDYDGKPTLYFLYAYNEKNITICGEGAIDGNEEIFYGEQNRFFIDGAFYPRMPLIYLEAITKLEIKEVKLKRSAFWTLHMVGCQNVKVHHIKIRNNLKLANCDGIDPDHCHKVDIYNCDIVCADDGIVFKNTKANQKYGDCAFIKVKNCRIKTTSGAIKFGTESFGDFHDIKVEKIDIYESNRGITMQLRDSGNIYNCSFKNIKIATRIFAKPYYWGYGEPLCITALNRSDDVPVGEIHHLTFKGIEADSEMGFLIYGENESRIHDILFDDVTLRMRYKSRWPKDKKDLRPYDKNPFISSKVNVLYLRNATNITMNRFYYSVEASLNDYMGQYFDVDQFKNLVINNKIYEIKQD